MRAFPFREQMLPSWPTILFFSFSPSSDSLSGCLSSFTRSPLVARFPDGNRPPLPFEEFESSPGPLRDFVSFNFLRRGDVILG